jgi:hypothetical protein
MITITETGKDFDKNLHLDSQLFGKTIVENNILKQSISNQCEVTLAFINPVKSLWT